MQVTNVAVVEGWRFYTADFSIDGRKGRVFLMRDKEAAQRFFALPEKEQDTTDLFVIGYGNTIDEAVVDANAKTTPLAT